MNITLVIHFNNEISNSHCKLFYHCRILQKKWRGEFLTILIPHGENFICQVLCISRN